jgi:catechol 2,3-dioxygenase-like lactoylglutathione lyase family enzyme
MTLEPPRLGYAILYVASVERSLDFYAAAFGLKPLFAHESGEWAELETGATRLGLCATALLERMGKTPAAPDPRRATAEIALVTADVEAWLTRALSAGARPISPVERMAWGQTIAYVADPDGHLVELCTPMAP